jgi:hypothetical protein
MCAAIESNSTAFDLRLLRCFMWCSHVIFSCSYFGIVVRIYLCARKDKSGRYSGTLRSSSGVDVWVFSVSTYRRVRNFRERIRIGKHGVFRSHARDPAQILQGLDDSPRHPTNNRNKPPSWLPLPKSYSRDQMQKSHINVLTTPR